VLHLEPPVAEPYLHNLLAFTVEDDLFPKLPSYLIRQRTVEALATLVIAEARRQPLALILEDVHWIDKATAEVAAALVEAMATVPLLLVLAYRPEYVHAWMDRAYHAQIALTRLPSSGSAEMVRAILAKPYAAPVSLEGLSPEHSKAIVQELLGPATAPPELEQLIATKTEGNPLFVEELTRSLLESGALERQNGSYILTKPPETLDFPATVQGVLLARVDRLNDELKEVLQVASVIGRVFSSLVLAEVVHGGSELEHVLLDLERLEFIYPTDFHPAREYSFKHVLTQEAVYSTLLGPKREGCHERIGQALEALYPDHLEEHYELLAYHYSRSGNKDKAVEYLDLANRKAAKANAMEDAKAYFDQAMRFLDTLPETAVNQQRRVALLGNQVMEFLLLLKLPEYHEHLTRYETMAIGLEDPALLGAFYASLGWCEWALGSYDRATQTETKAAELCLAAGNLEAAASAYVVLEWTSLYEGKFDQVFISKENVLRAVERQFSLVWLAKALAAASWAYSYLGQWERAVEEGQAELSVGEKFSDNSVISFAAWNLSIAYTYKGDLGRALEYAALAVEKAPTPADKAWAQCFLAWAWCRAGEPHRGIEILAQGVSIMRAGRFVAAQNLFQLFLGEAFWRAGQYSDARQALEEVFDLEGHGGMRFNIGSAHRLLGEVALSTNPTQVGEPLAAPHFESSMATLREIKAENELALSYVGYGRLHKQLGRIEEAREYLTTALEIFERLGTLTEPDKVRQALAELPDGPSR
jgi:tetratricopeptide (TPR) repeat protein